MERKFLQYKRTDFIEDQDFIQWVKHGTNDEFWNGLLKNANLKPEIEEAKEIVSAFLEPQRNLSKKTFEIWNRIDSTIIEEDFKAPKQKLVPKKLLWMAVAATVAVLLLFYFPRSSNEFNHIYTLAAQTTLPDKSIVEVNRGSTIKYNKTSFNTDRNLYLEGEAFFKVEKGSKFSVDTPNGKINVLGTSFNIYSRNNFLDVQCSTGKVEVVGKENKLIITAGMGARLQHGKLETYTIKRADIASWVKGDFYFKSFPLTLIFEEVERQFGKKIKLNVDISKKTANIFFNKNDLDKALEQICWPMKLKYEIKNDIIEINTAK